MRFDVVVVGAGTAGLVAGSILAKAGRRVALVERHRYLGGRAMEHRFRGHQLGLGSHLAEDPGDSLTRVCEHVGVSLVHSERSDSMPFWENGGWRPIQERYAGAGKAGVKRCIEALLETDWHDLERWDHASLREWMAQYTSDEGAFLVWEAISVLEQITNHWWEHSASENLFARKLAYTHRRTAGYSFWPMGGWEKLWGEMGDAFTGLGGELRHPAAVERIVVEDGRIAGVRLRGGEVLEADQAIVSAPVWDLPRLFDDGVLPWDLLQRIRLLANNRNRACWLGYWIAAREPVVAMTEREMASFFSTPRTGLPGFTLNFTGYDPGVSPPGEYLTCVGAAFDATEHYGDRAWIDRQFHNLWLDIEEMLPAARGALWKKPHLVTSYGVICRPGLVGAVRPDARVREVDGLWLTGDTTRARGIGVDKAARAGITAAEGVLGQRVPFFADTVRY
ncbi:MAG: NAD(P)/FAD-dependent oxidoreductase [Solirubrobacterales bacterium]|nr:NAD(P)/FAD-dependent oxidoreductase [Solirubrobacterales bacterium]